MRECEKLLKNGAKVLVEPVKWMVEVGKDQSCGFEEKIGELAKDGGFERVERDAEVMIFQRY